MREHLATKLEQTLLDEYRGDTAKALKELCRRYTYLVLRLDEPAPKPGPSHEPTEPDLFDARRSD